MIRFFRNYITIFIGFFIGMAVNLRWEAPMIMTREQVVLENIACQVLPGTGSRDSRPDVTIFDTANFTNMENKDLGLILNRTLTFGHFSEKARYKYFPNAFFADSYHRLAKEPLCAALQSTFNLVPSIKRYLQNWEGCVSYALFCPSYYFYFSVVYIKHLRKCHRAIRNQVTWHLSYPKGLPPPPKLTHLLKHEFNCSATDDLIFDTLQSSFNASKKWMPKDLMYPQNAMRNLARQHCKTRWVMCPDVDMVFPDPQPFSYLPSMYSRLNDFLRSKEALSCGNKCVFVFPLYEVADLGAGRVPGSKSELLEYVANGSAQIYHVQTFPENQGCSNLSTWEDMPFSDEIRIAAPIDFKFWYEPVYVIQQGSPKFDERYIGYGFTRNTQALELQLAGYQFHLLDTIFLCHLWGLKNKSSAPSKFRAAQAYYNSKVFYTFHARELAVRYDEDLGELLKRDPYKKFHWVFNIGLHVNDVDPIVQQRTAAKFAKKDKPPGSYGF